MKIQKLQEWLTQFDKAAGINSAGKEIEVTLHAAEELGEVAQCVLKLSGYKSNKAETIEHLEEEICDVAILMVKIANLYGIDFNQAMKRAQSKLEKRWGVSVDID